MDDYTILNNLYEDKHREYGQASLISKDHRALISEIRRKDPGQRIAEVQRGARFILNLHGSISGSGQQGFGNGPAPNARRVWAGGSTLFLKRFDYIS